MPTIQVLKNTLLNALNVEIAADPGVLERNLGGSNYALMDRTCRRLRANDQGWHLLGKTADRDGAKYTPADWRPLTVHYLGQDVALAGVSHDCLFYVGGITPEAGDGGPYPNGVQFDVLGSANYWDTPITAKAFVNGSAIPAHEYRAWNPPVRPGQWLEGGTQPPQPPSTTVPPFPPRDEVLNFGLALNNHYGSKGAGANGTLGAPSNVANNPRYLNFEGEVVWLPEYLRRRQLGETHNDATAHVLADVDAAWPK
jgi:hypothetical protein